MIVFHAALALLTFLTVLNGHLRGSAKPLVDAVLAIAWLTTLATGFFLFGSVAGAVAIPCSWLYGLLSRPIAARVAARMLSARP